MRLHAAAAREFEALDTLAFRITRGLHWQWNDVFAIHLLRPVQRYIVIWRPADGATLPWATHFFHWRKATDIGALDLITCVLSLEMMLDLCADFVDISSVTRNFRQARLAAPQDCGSEREDDKSVHLASPSKQCGFCSQTR